MIGTQDHLKVFILHMTKLTVTFEILGLTALMLHKMYVRIFYSYGT